MKRGVAQNGDEEGDGAAKMVVLVVVLRLWKGGERVKCCCNYGPRVWEGGARAGMYERLNTQQGRGLLLLGCCCVWWSAVVREAVVGGRWSVVGGE